MLPPQRTRQLAVLLSVLLLTACGGEQEELQSWMDQQRQQVSPNIQALTEPQRFHPEAYTGLGSEDPFSMNKLSGAVKEGGAQPNAAVTAELSRRKEPLEAFPLDTMTMVGSVSRKGVPYALLRVENLLYQVKVGDYLGQNYGKILQITETEVTLREIVQDAAGEWIERPTTLQLQEGGR